MIEFDINKFRIENKYVKYVTKSRGGNMAVLDTDNKSDKEKFIRVDLPAHVAARFANQNKMNRFLKPVLTAVCYYENNVVAMEIHPMGNTGKESVETLFGTRRWISTIEHNLENKIAQDTSIGKWFIDGFVVYKFNDDDAVNLTEDRKFQALSVDAHRLTDLSLPMSLDELKSTRTCIAYTASDGQTTISPPIWKTMGTIGDRKVEHVEEDNAITLGISEHQFDKVDRLLAVNLNFALHAATVITDNFGYEHIEPLRLDDLMVNLKTVNLQNLDRSIKNTYDVGMKFTHAIAWVIGLSNKNQSLESFAATRSILRYLTSRGIIHKTALNKSNVFKKGKNMDSVTQMPRKEIEEKRKAKLNELVDLGVDIST